MEFRFGLKTKKILREDETKYSRISREIYGLPAISEEVPEYEKYKCIQREIERIIGKYYPHLLEKQEVVLKEEFNNKKCPKYLIFLMRKRKV